MPTVTVVLPTYNRAHFLPGAFDSVRAQQFGDWELVVVDDGSTDRTREAVEELRGSVDRPVRYVYQENRGAYLARLAGVREARGKYVAFFDSDDYWLPHHLGDCVAALDANPDVGWSYGACRVEELQTGRVLVESTFGLEQAQPFAGLRTAARGPVRVIDDPRMTVVAIETGLYCGLQASVLRREVFDAEPFRRPHPLRVGEEVPMVLFAAKAGWRFGYLSAVHTVYRVHSQNLSAPAATGDETAKQLRVLREQAASAELVLRELPLTSAERQAIRRYLSRQYFWRIGYSVLLQNGRHAEAFQEFRRALRLRPWHLPFWKAYAAARVKQWAGLLSARRPVPPPPGRQVGGASAHTP
jgi:glycosyltransferase involved in cell wall biosynthesis